MQNFTVNPRGIASQHFEDETIILNLPKGNYYSLKESAQFVWAQLEKNTGSSDIAAHLSSYYGITVDEAKNSLDPFLTQLFLEELTIENANPENLTSPAEVTNTSGKPFSVPVLEVYTDMQELLMLDPIHDADPGKGWPYKNNEQSANSN